MSLYPNKKQIPQQMKISLALTTGFWNELYFYRAKFIITEWSLFELYSTEEPSDCAILQLLILRDFWVYRCRNLFPLLQSRQEVVGVLLK